MTATDVAAELDELRRVERGEVVLDFGMRFGDGSPVLVRVRKREWRYDVDDLGAGVALAGKPAGWREAAERLVKAEGLNVSRTGVVFVPAVEGGRADVGDLAARIAEMSRAVHGELLGLDD